MIHGVLAIHPKFNILECGYCMDGGRLQLSLMHCCMICADWISDPTVWA